MKKATSSLAHVYKAALQGLEEEKDRLHGNGDFPDRSALL